MIAALGVVILVARSSDPDSTSSRSVSTQQPQDEPREVDASPVDAGNAAQSEDGGVEAADAPPPAEPLRVCVVEGTSPVAGALIRHHDEEALAGTDGCATINATATVAVLCATKGELIGCTHVERNAGVPWSIARISVARGSYLLVVVESPERTPIVEANVEVNETSPDSKASPTTAGNSGSDRCHLRPGAQPLSARAVGCVLRHALLDWSPVRTPGSTFASNPKQR